MGACSSTPESSTSCLFFHIIFMVKRINCLYHQNLCSCRAKFHVPSLTFLLRELGLNDARARRSVAAPPTDDARTAAHSVHTLATREVHAHPTGAALTQAAAATARPKASCDQPEGPCGCNWRDQSPRSSRGRRERSLRVATRGAMRAGGDACTRLPRAYHDAPCGRTRGTGPPAERSGSAAALKAVQSDLQLGLPGPGLPGERAC